LAFRGVAFVRVARAAWNISLRTQRSLRRRTVDTSHVQVATQRHAALPSGARPIGTRTGCRPRALSRRGVRRRGERRRCRAEPWGQRIARPPEPNRPCPAFAQVRGCSPEPPVGIEPTT